MPANLFYQTTQTLGAPVYVTPAGATVNLATYNPQQTPVIMLQQTSPAPAALVNYDQQAQPNWPNQYPGWPQPAG